MAEVLKPRAKGLLEQLGNLIGIGTANAPGDELNIQPTNADFSYQPPLVVAQDVQMPEMQIIGDNRPDAPMADTVSMQPWPQYASVDLTKAATSATSSVRPSYNMPANAQDVAAQQSQSLNAIQQYIVDENTAPATPDDPDTDSALKSLGGLWDSTFGNEEWRLRKAMILNSMRLNPDAALTQAFASRIKDIRSTKKTNRTADALLAKGLITPDQAEMIRMGMDYKDVIASGKTSSMQTLEQRATAAGLEPGSEAYKQFMLTGGQPKGMQLRVLPDGTVEFAESGGLGGVKLNESQANSLMYSNRMLSSNEILERLETEGTDLGNALVENVPLAGNYLLSPEYRQYAQARRDFINAVLRKESGAVISPEEFANSTLQYFPQPGDDPVTIEQKRQNRLTAIKSMRQALPKAVTEQQEEPSKSKSASIPPAPQGVDQAEWQSLWPVMSPQEKSLFSGGK